MTDSIRKGRTAVIYARVSTKGQADTGTSIETQLKVCRKWCEHEGVEVIGEFHDDGVSGTTTDRDAFSSMFGAIISKKPFYLVVYDSDRLTREGPGELENLKAILEKLRVETIYAGMGGLSANSTAAKVMDTYKSASDSLFVPLQKKKSQESVDRLITEGKHVSRSAGFVFEEDIPLMPKGRVLLEDRVREKKDPDGTVVRTVTKATVIASEKDFFALVDRGASIEVIAEMWGLGRHCLTEAVKGKSRCVRERCPIPDRYPEYVRRLQAAKESGVYDPVFEPYRNSIRKRALKERAQCRAKATERRADGNKGSESTVIPRLDHGNKGAES
jgi:hypothetical protein